MHFCVSTVCNPKCRNLFILCASLHCFWFQPNLSSKGLWPRSSCLALGHEDQCVDKHRKDLQSFGTWTWLTLGNLARVAFRDIEHVTSDFWRSMYSCSLVEDSRTALLMEFNPTDFLYFWTGSKKDMSYCSMYFAAKTPWRPWFPCSERNQHFSIEVCKKGKTWRM